MCVNVAFLEAKPCMNPASRCRLAALKEVVIPGSAKEDQAGFLKNAANYIRHLQVTSIVHLPGGHVCHRA